MRLYLPSHIFILPILNCLSMECSRMSSLFLIFFLATCGTLKDGYFKAVRTMVLHKQCEILGEYSCLGFDTFGPFKLFGGIAKGHPSQDEIEAAVTFYRSLK